MYQYECDFGSFYHNPTILETVSFVSKWVNMDFMENGSFSSKFNNGEKFYHQCVFVKIFVW